MSYKPKDPTGRVMVTLTFATADPASMVQQNLLHRLDGFTPGLVGVSTFAFDEAVPEPDADAFVYEVYGPIHGSSRAMAMGRFFDHAEAEAHARKVGGVLVELPAAVDFRPQASDEVTV